MKRSIAIATTVLLIALLSGCQSDEWTSIKKKYAADENVRQLLLVKATEGSSAIVEFLEKDAKGKWVLVREGDAHIGLNGIGKTREGDMKSPVGEFGIRKAFGILPNPGTTIEYLQLTESIFGCDEPCEYYNTIIDTAVVHHDCHGEDMSKVAPGYNYGLETRYNDDNIQGLGSCIFIHCKGPKPSTSGCVALDEDFMREVLVRSDSDIIISIHQR